ncbi:hypothetical protein CJP74_01605 [Psittacicella melopsittaci]|uniref:Glycosyl transferase family 25 domain-containing protein n=1 Tax=Psittacicella melopsittaci TaxID=2028576 RepID=A0A3A1Y8Q9_9GAMM|nr:glycosyltransferase family 25 protein [Psittacicella melopsittaci]RIY33588.1 hypothetical protein CJP74_01605 [Psittacicella melopsittaci]
MHKFISRAYLITDLNGPQANALSLRQPHSEYLEPVKAIALEKLSPELQDLLLDLDKYTDFYKNTGAYRQAKLKRSLSHLRLWQQISQDPSIPENNFVLIVESGVALANDWLRKVRLLAEQYHDGGLNVICLSNNLIHDFAPRSLEQLGDYSIVTSAELEFPVRDPVQELFAHPAQKLYATRSLHMTGSGAYLIRKAALKEICQQTYDLEQVLAHPEQEFAERKKVSWNTEGWHEYFTYKCGHHAYLVPALGVEVFDISNGRELYTSEQVYNQLTQYRNQQSTALSYEQAKSELEEQQQHWQELNPAQRQLLTDALPVQTGESLRASEGANFLSKVRKYVIADPGIFAWQSTNALSRFFAQAGTSDFKLRYLPQTNDPEYLKFLTFHRLHYKPLTVPLHLPLNEYRYNYAWGNLIKEILTDASLSDHDWVMLCEDTQVFTPDWQRKLNLYLDVVLTSEPNAKILLLADEQAQDFKPLNQEKLTELQVLPSNKVASWAGQRLEPLHLIKAAQAIAQVNYQLEHKLALKAPAPEQPLNILANLEEVKTPALYSPANEQFAGGLGIPPELEEAIGKDPKSLSPELQKLVDIFWQASDIDVTQLKLEQVQLGEQSFTRPLLPENQSQVASLGQNGLEAFALVATAEQGQEVKALVPKYQGLLSEEPSAYLEEFRQQINQPFTGASKEKNQAKLNDALLSQYTQALRQQKSYLLGSGSKFYQTRQEIRELWPTALSIDAGHYLVTDWQPFAYQAISIEVFRLRRYPHVMLNVGALRARAKAHPFNPRRFNAKSLTSVIDFNYNSIIYANPGFSWTRKIERHNAYELTEPSADNVRLLQAQHPEPAKLTAVERLPKFLINLDKDTERLHKFELQVGKDTFTRISAVYGKDYTKEELEQMFDTKRYFEVTHKIPTPSEMGCTLSHCKVYKQVLADQSIKDQDWVLVAEDDNTFSPQWQEKLEQILNFLETPYAQGLDYIQLGHTYAQNFALQNKDVVVATTSVYIDATEEIDLGAQLKLYPLAGFLPAASYMYLVRKGALREHEQDFSFPYWVADHFTYFIPFKPGSYAMSNPVLGIQDFTFTSNIQEDRAQAELLMRNNLKKTPIGWHEVRDFLDKNKFVLQRELTLEEIKTKFPGFEIIPAFNYKALSEQEFKQRYNREKFIETYGREPSDDDINRALQHQQVYRLLAQRAKNIFEFALIIEDNIITAPGHDLVKEANLYLKYVDTRLTLAHRLVLFSNSLNPQPFIALKDKEQREGAYVFASGQGEPRPGYELCEVNVKARTGASAYMVINLNLMSDKADSTPVFWLYDDFTKFLSFTSNSFSYANPCLVASPGQDLSQESE